MEDGSTYLDVQRREALLHDHCSGKRLALELVGWVCVGSKVLSLKEKVKRYIVWSSADGYSTRDVTEPRH